MLTLDTSALYALLNRADPDHVAVTSARNADPGPYIVPAGILAEIADIVENRLGLHVLSGLLADLASGTYDVHCGEEDFRQIDALMRRYHDLPLGYADALVATCAEKHAGRVLTLDDHFWILAREGKITVVELPEQ
jgi:uncharacterized protein